MHRLYLPIEEPILVLTLVLFIVLIIPILLRKTVIPSIVGLIAVGIVIGPFAGNILDKNDTLDLFSQVGLLYIMFLAGLEIEITSFLKNRNKNISFGILTFILPFLFGYFTGLYLLKLAVIPSILVGIMLASNTLIAFPLTGMLGITKTPAVNIAISGTVIADTIVLVLLAFISSSLQNIEDGRGMWIFIVSFSFFVFIMFYVLPKICRWFFKNITNDGTLQFLFTLSVLFLSSLGSEVVGAEPIIGAFFAGLSLNRLIPASSTLMNRIDFVGNTLFIPFFLLSVGMLFDFTILFTGYRLVIYAGVFVFIGLLSKWMAAFLTKVVFKQTRAEMNTIFALTSARAAATLAIAIIGIEYNIISEDLFNSIILLILITSLFSSFYTEKAGRILAKEDKLKIPDSFRTDNISVLVPIANPKNIERLIELATLITDKTLDEPIYPLSIVKDTMNARQQILKNDPIIENVQKQAAANGAYSRKITRVDVNIPTAIARVSKELDISDIIMGWSGRSKEIEKMFSNMLEAVLRSTTNTVIVSHLPKPIGLTTQIPVFVSTNAQIEKGFKHWGKLLERLSNQLSAVVEFHVLSKSRKILEQSFKSEFNLSSFNIVEYDRWPNIKSLNHEKYDLTVFVNARLHSVSFNQTFHRLTYQMPDSYKSSNILNIYTQQHD